MRGKDTEVWEGLDQYGKVCVPEKEAGEQLNDKDDSGQKNEKETRKKDGGEMKNSDMLADMVDDSEEVRKRVENFWEVSNYDKYLI